MIAYREVSKSGKSHCVHCKTLIKSGEIRVNVTSPDRKFYVLNKKYHLECFKQILMDSLNSLNKGEDFYLYL